MPAVPDLRIPRNNKRGINQGGAMEEQQSQKTGIRSDAQKQNRAREGYDPLSASQPVAGAFGEHKPDRTSDQDASLVINTRKQNKND
jgi:hypothetical protein